MRAKKYTASSSALRQNGAALIISLILFVVMTLLGLAAIRSITQEERMAGHSYSRSLAFQSTESALRSAEVLVESIKPTPTIGCSNTPGVMVCATPAVADTPRWTNTSFTSWENLSPIGSGTLAITPQYFVEYLGNTFPCDPGASTNTDACKRYRITARSGDGSGGKTAVMLQSIYATD